MKATTSFVCQECGYDSVQWLGKCPQCGEWNSLREIKTGLAIPSKKEKGLLEPLKLSKISKNQKQRILTSFSEADGVLGGGIVEGSVTLLAGDPGIGKSTLLLQIAISISKKQKVLYVSGEESADQIKMRAKRLTSSVNLENFLLLSANDSDQIASVVIQEKPGLVIIDSIQTMESENLSGLSGSIGQVRYAASLFIKTAKSENIPIILVGHVTKEGMVAGPMILSHMVDTLLVLEGEKVSGTRILRSLKNRFGPVDEVGVFSMHQEGMKEIKNPEQVFLTKRDNNQPGSVVVATMEGTRSFLVEVQALAVFSKLVMPRRVASGIDYKKLELLLAVLQKHCRLPVDSSDIFVNVAGGLKLSDPAADLGVCLAVYSSLKNKPISKTIGIGEVGLLGEIRPVAFLEKRVKQAKKLGFTKILTPERYKNLNSVIKTLE